MRHEQYVIELTGQSTKFDLTRYNEPYFANLRSRVAAAARAGIYVSIMLFQGWSVEKKGHAGNPWHGHPFHAANNINGIDGDPTRTGEGKLIHTIEAPAAITAIQESYVAKVIATVNDLDNVLYEIGKEMHTGTAT